MSALHGGCDPLCEGDRQAAGFNGAKAGGVKLADKIANLRDVEVPPPLLASFNGCAMIFIAR